MNTIGKNLKITIFGESHGNGVGAVVDGLPAGIELPHDLIRNDLDRRRPGSKPFVTTRKEPDHYEILSGVRNDITNGYPLTVFVKNSDVDDRDANVYADAPRPGHADYPAIIKHHGMADIRGGGESSGRMTVPIVIAGAIAKHLLMKKEIFIYGYTAQIGRVKIPETIPEDLLKKAWSMNPYSVPDAALYEKMVEEVGQFYAQGDSVGGVIECISSRMPVGMGDPFFNSMESVISSYLFSIPGIKGVYFGDGLNTPYIPGSKFNDELYVENDAIRLKTNHNGGINGGLTNGNPLKIGAMVRPPSSIKKNQKTVRLSTKEEVELTLKGRYDPCIVPRMVVVMESMIALSIADLVAGDDL